MVHIGPWSFMKALGFEPDSGLSSSFWIIFISCSAAFSLLFPAILVLSIYRLSFKPLCCPRQRAGYNRWYRAMTASMPLLHFRQKKIHDLEVEEATCQTFPLTPIHSLVRFRPVWIPVWLFGIECLQLPTEVLEPVIDVKSSKMGDLLEMDFQKVPRATISREVTQSSLGDGDALDAMLPRVSLSRQSTKKSLTREEGPLMLGKGRVVKRSDGVDRGWGFGSEGLVWWSLPRTRTGSAVILPCMAIARRRWTVDLSTACEEEQVLESAWKLRSVLMCFGLAANKSQASMVLPWRNFNKYHFNFNFWFALILHEMNVSELRWRTWAPPNGKNQTLADLPTDWSWKMMDATGGAVESQKTFYD